MFASFSWIQLGPILAIGHHFLDFPAAAKEKLSKKSILVNSDSPPVPTGDASNGFKWDLIINWGFTWIQMGFNGISNGFSSNGGFKWIQP